MPGYPVGNGYVIAPEAQTPKWNPQQEQSFLTGMMALPWYKEYQQKFGEAPDLNSSDYNYRAAWQSGARPEYYPPDKSHHWPSVNQQGESLKAKNHPSAWMEDYMQLTGGADPSQPAKLNQSQIDALVKALQFRYSK